MSKPKPGDVIIVKVGGHEYETVIDEQGVQRFPENTLIRYLVDMEVIDLNWLRMVYDAEAFSQLDYLRFNMGLGYSVDGLAELSAFEDLEIENPLWPETE